MTNQSEPLDRKALLKNALIALDEMQSRLDAMEHSQHEPIAIIGIGCRFPGDANTPDAYWKLLHNGVDAIQVVPPERWDISQYADLQMGKPISWYGGFLSGIDQFDPQFFGISPREANSMDPQQRLVLEVSWEAFERANIPPDKLLGTQTGVFVGVTTNDYSHMVRSMDPSQMDVYAATGSALNAIPGRVAYTFGLHGPSIAVDTACSSSLVAIHLACKSLRSKECDLAVAGGVNATLTPEAFICFAGWGMMAPDGRCKTFDSRADGFVRGEGCGMLVLKRLSDAIKAGDHIQAVIRGSAVNQDGRSSGLTVPNGRAQQAVIRAALKDAGIAPARVSYVETHGTGTSLGDPIEIEAVGAALGEGRSASQPLTIGSVKTNIGHLESASGVAGVIKTILALQHREFPPHLHLHERSPRIPWPNFPIEIPDQPTPWTAPEGGRIAGISSFGFSGTNAHIILEETPELPPAASGAAHAAYLLALSAKTDGALKDLAGRYADQLQRIDAPSVGQVCQAALAGRSIFNNRLAVTGASPEALRESLAAYASGQQDAAVFTGQAERGGPGKIAFLFTGQGSQWVQMGRQLYEYQPVFRQALDACDALLQPHLPAPLLSVIFGADGESGLLDNTRYTQPALFALEYALVQLWKSWGIQPDAVMGHSVGEYAAACAAGVFSLEDGIRLIAERARLISELPEGGQMAAVFASEERVSSFLAGSPEPVSIAAVNGPENTVISGSGPSVQAVLDALQQEGIQARMLQVSHAFHSNLMDAILDPFEEAARSVQFSAPSITLISNVTGQPETDLVCNPEYWRRHIRQPVRFNQGIQALYEMGYRIFIEIGPNPVLNGMAQRCLPAEDESLTWLTSLRKGRGDEQQILESLGALWVRGARVEWTVVFQDTPAASIDLPTYPFQYERYWLEETLPTEQFRQPSKTNLIHPLLGTRLSSPLYSETVIETKLTTEQPSFLKDHRLNGKIVFPGTGYLEMGMAVGKHILEDEDFVVEDLSIVNLLSISEKQEKTLQTVVAAHGDYPAKFQIFSLEDAAQGKWVLHAEGNIHSNGANPAQSDGVLEGYRQRCSEPVQVQDYYNTLEAVGLGYGKRFRCLRNIWKRDNEAIGEVALPDDFAHEAAQYILHPGLLDSCFQLIGAVLPRQQETTGEQSFYVPVAIHRYQFQGGAGTHFFACMNVQKNEFDGARLTGNILFFNLDGASIGSIEGLQIRKISSDTREHEAKLVHASQAYKQQWVQSPVRIAKENKSKRSGKWILIENDPSYGEIFARGFEERGITCARIVTANTNNALDSEVKSLESFKNMLSENINNLAGTLEGIVFLCGNGSGEVQTTSDLEHIQEQVVGNLVATAQVILGLLEQNSAQTSLVIVTHGAQSIVPGDMLPALAHSAVWGIGKTIGLENPQLKCTCIDLDPSAAMQDAVEQLVITMRADSEGETEERIAFRSNTRYAARLVYLPPADDKGHSAGVKPFADHLFKQPFELMIHNRGVLDNIELRASKSPSLGPNQVSIHVQAAGLNFRDVLNVLGLLPGAEAALGHECVGKIAAVGENVTQFKIGDEVMGIASGSFGTYAVTYQDLIVHKPDEINTVEAATIPLAFLTAYYALVQLGRLQKGERVLIHGAAGGVGMAAVQIALQAGAEIFATAGNPSKRDYLKSLGVHHVMDSRSLVFADETMQLTNGEGVDLVLNSLTDGFIQKSFEILKPGGRFMEIGKRGIWSHEQVKELKKNHQYHIIMIGDICLEDPALIQSMLQVLANHFTNKKLIPLPAKVFPIGHAVEAFRYMAQAKHIGKIVLTVPTHSESISKHGEPISAHFGTNPEQSQAQIFARPDSTYLITGGLGGIGLETADWLISKGAKSIALMSRRDPDEKIAARLERLRAEGIQVMLFKGDVAKAEDIKSVLQKIHAMLPPLKGICHAAGILDDGVFLHQDWSNFERVFAPKIYGAWNLHLQTTETPLDFFILFSAGASLFGSPGQANYAGANAFLDSLAHFRRARGLTALAINWGPWGEVGMAARLPKAMHQRWEKQGIHPISTAACFRWMEELASSDAVHAGVFDIEWPLFFQQFDGSKKPPFFDEITIVDTTHVTVQKPSERTVNIRAKLDSADSNDRKNILEGHLKSLIGQVIGHKSPNQISALSTFAELGIDSLMAIELRNRIQDALGVNLPLNIFFGTTSLTDLMYSITAIIWTSKEIQVTTQEAAEDREDFQL